MEAKLTPVYEAHKNREGKKVTSVEAVICHIAGYPLFMAHSDLVWDACKEYGDDKMYEALQAGKIVEVDITIKPLYIGAKR